MNWQAVVDSLREDIERLDRERRSMGERHAFLAVCVQGGLKALADALQMGVNERNKP